MTKLESSFINMLLALAGVSLFAAAALGLVYSLTEAPIAASKTAGQQRAVKEVLPSHERLEGPETVEVEDLGTFEIYKAYDGDHHFAGAAVTSFSKKGFSGEIKILVGFDEQGFITDYSVLEQKETPGLGTKIVDWFKPAVQVKKSLVERLTGYEASSGERKNSIIGKNPAVDALTVAQDGGDIDAITAATISSRAFLEAVRNACAAYSNNPGAMDAASGATSHTESSDSGTKLINMENDESK
ncbi:MAG: RnfABCDGE type electron transport complex subunit G [Tannerella sp.]|jgi:electron transport complex protein RnfG|nr:RnfABCDGE type electron transport complex subunit G [Tannerella sp.]